MRYTCKGCERDMLVLHGNVFRMMSEGYRQRHKNRTSKKFWFICPRCCYGNMISEKEFPLGFGLRTVCRLYPIKGVTKFHHESCTIN